MIINSKDVCYIIVELDAEDVEKIMEGKDIIKQNHSDHDDRDVLVRCYCSNPRDIDV